MSLPDSVVLKSMIDDATQGGWCYDPAKEYRPGVNGARNIDGPQEGIFSYGGSVTIAVTGPSDDPQSMADAALIALAPALAAEVIRLRELVSPSTPEGKLAQWKAAKELLENSPRAPAVAGEWAKDGENWHRHDLRRGDGHTAADVMLCTNGRWMWFAHGAVRTVIVAELADAQKAADQCLRAAGWELVGGSDV